ncbi:MAG TPA: PilZ domain-containing protein [Marinagarivorans sp.]
MSSNQEDRRQYSRVVFDAKVSINQGDHSFVTELVDISLNGLLVKTPAQYHLRSDMPCRVRILLSQEVQIAMQVALVHSGDQALGFHCTSIDMDSITHLRRLIETNLEDPNASERVLAELVIKAELNEG